VRNDRVARRKAQAEAYTIESRWTTNITDGGRSQLQYDTQLPGQVKHRGLPERSIGAGVTAQPSMLGAQASVAAPVHPQLQHVNRAPQGMSPGTWPRPQSSSASSASDLDFQARQSAMRKWRDGGSLSLPLHDRDQLYRIEAEGMALDFALTYVATRIKVQPEHFSRATVKLVQKAVSMTVAKFDEFFATRELAPIEELRQLTFQAVDELRFVGGQEKLSSLSDMDTTYSSTAALVACCGKVGGRTGGMEDRHVCLPNFYTLMHLSTLGEDAFFCAVYDGHAGPLCADFCRLQLHLNMIRQHRNKEWPEALRAAFFDTDQQFREIARVRKMKDGTTATVLLIEDSTLYHANVGDGEGFLLWKSGKIEPVTKAHKVSDPSEIARIQEMEKRKQVRVLLNLKEGGMAICDPEGNYMRVSRSIGDPNYDSEIVTCEPDVGKIQLTAEAELVVIGSDGIWDVISFKEAADILSRLSAPNQVKAAEILVDEAIRRGSMDNCTAVVVFLQKKRQSGKSTEMKE
jgi:serine/threonine protein phosphatase PrpC